MEQVGHQKTLNNTNICTGVLLLADRMAQVKLTRVLDTKIGYLPCLVLHEQNPSGASQQGAETTAEAACSGRSVIAVFALLG